MKRIFLVLALVALAGAAHAQTADIFHNSGGTSYNNPLTTLRVLGSGQDETRDLTIEAREWPATVSFRVGEGSGCGRSGGRWENGSWIPAPKTQLVGFHNASGKYTGGTNIATACRHYRCSQPMTDGICESPHVRRWFPATGMFTVRIWGKLCLKGPTNAQRCWNLKNPAPPAAWPTIARFAGYRATFGPGGNCGPARTVDGAEGSYAAWCDFTVDIR